MKCCWSHIRLGLLCLLACAACQRAPQSGAPAAHRTVQPAAPIAAPRPLRMSFGGRCTNLVEQSVAGWHLAGQLAAEDHGAVLHACRVQPDNPDLWLLAGMYSCDDALAYLNRAITLAPDAFLPQLALMREVRRKSDRDLTYHVSTCVFACAVTPVEVMAWCDQAQANFIKGDNPAALLYTNFICRLPPTPQAVLARAFLAVSLGMVTDAVAATRAVLAQETNSMVRNALAARMWVLGSNVALLAGCDAPPAPAPLSAFDTLLQQISANPSTAIGIVWCSEALQHATNASMRITVAQYLLQAHNQGRQTISNLDAFADAILGADVPPADIMATWLFLLRQAHATNALQRQLVRRPLDAAVALWYLKQLSWESSEQAAAQCPLDLQVLDVLAAHLPSNAAVARAMAAWYARQGLVADEIACCSMALALETNDYAKARAAAQLSDAYLKDGDSARAAALLPLLLPLAREDGVIARATALCQLAAGNSNDACELLLACCSNNNDLPQNDKCELMRLVLNTTWPDAVMQTRAVQTCFDCLMATQLQASATLVYEMSREVLRALVQLDRPGDAFALLPKALATGSIPFELARACAKPNWKEQLAQFINAAPANLCTQYTYAVCVGDLAAAVGLRAEALALYRSALRHERQAYYDWFMHAQTALRLARELDDATARVELLENFDAVLSASAGGADRLAHLRWCCSDEVDQAQFGTWRDLVWRSSTNKLDPALLNEVIPHAMNGGQTNLLREIAAHLAAQTNLSFALQAKVCALLAFAGDTNACLQSIAALGTLLTNAAMIESCGADYLDLLLRQANNQSNIAALVGAWCTNAALSVHQRFQFLDRIVYNMPYQSATQSLWRLWQEATSSTTRGYIQEKLLYSFYEHQDRAALANFAEQAMRDPTTSDDTVASLARYFEYLSMPADALVLTEQLLARKPVNAEERVGLLVKLAQLYGKTDNRAQLAAYAEQALQAAPPQYRIQVVAGLVEAFRAGGQADRAQALLLDAFNKATTAGDVGALAQYLAECNDVPGSSINPRQIAERVLAMDSSLNGVKQAATLLVRYGEYDAARACVQRALADATVPADQCYLYENLASIAAANDNVRDQADALEKLFALQSGADKRKAAEKLCAVLVECGRYDDALVRAQEMLAAMDKTSREGQQLLKLTLDAQLQLGQADAAWATAQQIADPAQFTDIAQRLGHTADVRPRLEAAFQTADTVARMQLAGLLMNVYEAGKDTRAMAALAADMAASASAADPQQALAMANLCTRGGMPDAALAILKNAHANATLNARGETARAIVNLLQRTQRYDEALQWLATQPADTSTRALAARIYDDKGDVRTAVDAYCDLLRDAGSQGAGYDLPHYLAHALQRANDPALIEHALARLSANNSANKPELCAGIADMFQRMQDHEKSLAWWQQAAQRESSPSQKQFYQWQMLDEYTALRRWDGVIDNCRDRLEKGSDEWGVRDQLRSKLANAYQQDGRADKADAILREQLRDCEHAAQRPGVYGNLAHVRFRLAELYRQNGQPQKSATILRALADDHKSGWFAARASQELRQYHGQ